MTNHKKRNAILFSMFAFIGLGGIGHFYLNKFKEGFVFLIVGAMLEISVPLSFLSIALEKPQIDAFSALGQVNDHVMIILAIFGIVSIIRIYFITRNET